MVWGLQKLTRQITAGGPVQISNMELIVLLGEEEYTQAVLGDDVSEAVRGELASVGLEVFMVASDWYVAPIG